MVNPIQITQPQAYSGGVDFTPLASLGEIYKRASNERRLSDLGKSLAAGSTDYRTAAGQLAEMGDTNSMLKFIALAEQQRKEQLGLEASRNFGGFIAPLVSGGAAAPQRASETIVGAPSAKVEAPELVPNPAADDPNAPIRTNPDGTIAGNITSPRVPIARSMPAETSAPIPAVTPAPPLPQLTDFNDRFNAARPSGVAPAGAPPTPVVAGEPEAVAATTPVTAVSKPRAPLAATRLPGEPDFISAVPGALAALRNPYLPPEDKKIAEDIIKRGWDSATPTDKIRTLRAYKADANDPRTLLEIEKDLIGKGATQITIGGEKKYQETVEKELADDFITMQKAGRTAANTRNTMSLMKQAATDPRFDSGLLPEVTTAVKRTMSAMGVAGANEALPNEVFDKLSKQQVSDIQDGKLGSGFSNTDLLFVMGANANRQNTPAGNLAVLDIQDKIAERKQTIARMSYDYARAHRDKEGNPKLDYGFYAHLDDWAQKNPLFPQGLPALNPAPPTGAVPAAPAAPAAPKIGEIQQHGRPYLGGNPADPKSWGPRQ